MSNDYYDILNRKIDRYKGKYKNTKIVALKLAAYNIRSLFKNDKVERISPGKVKPKSILFRLYGGMGDIIINMNYIQNFYKKIGKRYSIDVTGKNNIIRELWPDLNFNVAENNVSDLCYSLVIDLVRVPKIRYASIIEDVQLNDWIKLIKEFETENLKIFNCFPENDGILNQITKIKGLTRKEQPDISNWLGDYSENNIAIPNDSVKILKKFNLIGKKFITVSRACEVSFAERDCTKMLPVKAYETLLGLIKKENPEILIVQLGTSLKTTYIIDGVDLNLIGKTSLRDVIVLMAEAHLHIDSEGGLVHLRHFVSKKPSLVFFGPTDIDFYKYDENFNINGNSCGPCEWLSNNWQINCIKNKGSACSALNSIVIDSVFESIKDYIKS